MKNHINLLLILFLIPGISISQKESNIWYFGDSIGLDFNYTPPTPIYGGALKGISNAIEGTASICDTSGNLLFYTNGETIWNHKHDTMVNGNGLKGHRSSTQSSIIIPQPQSNSIFYLFTSDKVVPTGPGIYSKELHFSIIDISKQNDDGEVIEKNTMLSPGIMICEKLAATTHANGCDAWLLVHEWKSNKFYAYQVTSAGVNPLPVVSSIGRAYRFMGGVSGNNGAGQMKISIDGKKVLSVKNETDSIEVFNFNNATGVVSNPIYLFNSTSPNKFEQPYGAEFSPDGSKIYVTNFVSTTCQTNCSRITQFDLSLGSQAAILASATHIRTADPTISSLQLGPDGKIYGVTLLDNYLCAINSPNLAGISCNFVEEEVKFNHAGTTLGLPSIYNKYCFDISTTSVKEYENDANIRINPNPGNGLISIVLPKNYAEEKIIIKNYLGQTITTLNSNIDNNPFELNWLPQGIYLISVKGLKTQKMIINHSNYNYSR